MILIKIPSLDTRVADILSDPDRYFADATARARIAAAAEVDADLAERARHRLNHHMTRPPSWLPATIDERSDRR